MSQLPIECRAMIEGRNFAYLGTIRSDGSAAVTPTWVDLVDDLILVNGAAGRAWTKHLINDPRVTVCVSSLHNPYEALTVRGRVVSHERDDRAEHYAKLAAKYRGRTSAQPPLGQERIVFKIAVDQFGYRTQEPPDETAHLLPISSD